MSKWVTEWMKKVNEIAELCWSVYTLEFNNIWEKNDEWMVRQDGGMNEWITEVNKIMRKGMKNKQTEEER